MSKSPKSDHYDDALDEQTLQLLSESPAALDAQPGKGLRDRVMCRIDEAIGQEVGSFVTVRADDGSWIELAPGLKKKVLKADPITGAESYLLKAGPGAEAPPHRHDYDEHCLVLEGDVSFGDGIVLHAGDYHFAPRGSEHGIARTETGALVYLQTDPRGMAASI